jgi:hypothetical protein
MGKKYKKENLEVEMVSIESKAGNAIPGAGRAAGAAGAGPPAAEKTPERGVFV